MAMHALDAAALAGCRAAIVADADTSDVEASAAAALKSAGMFNYTVTVTPSELDAVDQWAPVTVNVSVPYHSVSWIGLSGFFSEFTMQGSCTLPREAESE